MGEESIIGWTHSTQNFWRGCDKVGPGCAFCYMFRDQARYGRDPSVVIRCSPPTFNAPLSAKWARRRAAMIDAHGQHLVFTCSWSDFFHDAADPWRDEAWDVIRQTPGSTYQILTKRPELIADRLPADWGDGWANVWLGVTIENARFMHRADTLREIPTVLRFISYEPALGPLDGIDLAEFAWVIGGGESGGPAHRRLVDPHNDPIDRKRQWMRDVRDLCLDAQHRPAFFFKQWGGATPTSGGRILDARVWDEIPEPTWAAHAVR